MGQARAAIKNIVFSLSRQWPTGSRNASASSSPHRRMRPTDAPAEGSMESTLPTRLNGRQRLQLVAKGRHPTAGFHDGRFFVCQTATTCPTPPPISSPSSDTPAIAAQWSAPCRHAVTPSRQPVPRLQQAQTQRNERAADDAVEQLRARRHVLLHQRNQHHVKGV